MPDFKPYTESELREIDHRVDKEMRRINVVDWTVSLLTVGVLWALYERLKKPIFKNLDIFAAASISKEHIIGKRKPGGALGKVENIKDVLPFSRIQRNMLRFAQMSAAENIAQMSDRTKHTLRLMLTRSKLQGTSSKELAEQMRLTFKGLDRDWRRIVVTESASIATNGYIMSQGEGQQIIGQSAVDACPWCKSMIHGKIFTVTHTAPQSATKKEWDSHIWPGKNNVLRSRHAKKMGGKKRGPSELWKPTVPMHPHCRCRWVAFNPRFHEVTATGSVKAR